MGKSYSLRKSKKILYVAVKRAKRRQKDLSQEQKVLIQEKLELLQLKIKEKNKEEASTLAKEIEERFYAWIPKTIYEKALDFSMVIAALLVAICIRQMWFELYTIPSGSMRPTLKEMDNLLVIKDPYGINTPWRTGHYSFDIDKIKNGNIIVFTAQDLDTQSPDTMYFYLIPGKKQFVKRMIGKPGDTLYFYGGKIYGIDKNNNPIEAFQSDPWFQKLEHVPYIQLEGKVKTPNQSLKQGVFTESVFYQMNIPVAKLSTSSYGYVDGKMLGKYKDLDDYYQLWGIENYGSSRILTQSQLNKLTPHFDSESDYYLQIIHHPSIEKAALKRDNYHRYRPSLHTETSYIPLSKKELEKIFDHMTTARFVVKDGYISRYGANFDAYKKAGYLPKTTLPNGTYEFGDGVAYSVGIRGYLSKLDKDHPIYDKSPKNVQLFYNLGYEFINLFSPQTEDQPYLPSRFVYFSNGDLYGTNHILFEKEDPNLKAFVEKEKTKPHPFVDSKPFLNNDGSYNIAFFKKYGVTVPDDMYMALGDNHAMSGDSRDFGFVPQQNLRGGASFVFFPPSSRWGFLPQPSWELFTFSRVMFWVLGSVIIIGYMIYMRRRKNISNIFDL
jgi:signal peptidase I